MMTRHKNSISSSKRWKTGLTLGAGVLMRVASSIARVRAEACARVSDQTDGNAQPRDGHHEM